MRANARVPKMRHPAQIAVFNSGLFERAGALGVVGAAGNAVDEIVCVGRRKKSVGGSGGAARRSRQAAGRRVGCSGDVGAAESRRRLCCVKETCCKQLFFCCVARFYCDWCCVVIDSVLVRLVREEEGEMSCSGSGAGSVWAG